jgi:predicted O-methyltransferase YrrM
MSLTPSLRRLLDRVVSPIVSAASRSYYTSFFYANRFHPHYALLQDALAETVEYIKSDMSDALIRKNAFDVLTFASKRVRLDGLFLEFGVSTGATIAHIARAHPKRTIHGFDSFDGLPEAWSGFSLDKGAFRRSSPPPVPTNVELHVGWFDDTLAPFLAEHDGPVALVHIDSDLYSSAKTILDELAPRIQTGTIIVFNEYFNYPNWKQHEFRAFQEFCAANGVDYTYLCWGMYEVAVEITAITH